MAEEKMGDAGERQLRTCPRCGAKLFADMGICYGCLYDFSRERGRARGLPGGTGESQPGQGRAVGQGARDASGGPGAPGVASVPVEGRDLRPEPSRMPAGTPALAGGHASADSEEIWGSLDELWQDDPTAPPEGAPAPCRAIPDGAPREGGHEPHRTLRLAGVGNQIPSRVRVCAPGLSVTCAVPDEGLTVGRDGDNGVSVGSLTVSRHHVRLVPEVRGVLAQDLGATNPALLNGRPLVSDGHLYPGDVLEIRGAGITIRPCPS